MIFVLKCYEENIFVSKKFSEKRKTKIFLLHYFWKLQFFQK